MLLRLKHFITIVWIILFFHYSQQLSTVDRNRAKPLIDSRQTIECHRREYTFKATQTDANGRQCWQYITAMSCWGRCDSGEIADWRFPYKRSFHPVCSQDKMRIRRIRLKYCDADSPPELRIYELAEALTCVCKICQTSVASCEGVPSIGTRAP